MGAVRALVGARSSTVRLPHHQATTGLLGDEILTVAEVARMLKLAPKTVRNLMSKGTLRRGAQWFSPPGLGPRFRRSAVERWLETPPEGPPVDGQAYGADIPRSKIGRSYRKAS